MRTALLTAALALAVGGCDNTPGSDDGPFTFQGVELEPVGDATLSVENDRLVVSGLDGDRSGGFRMPDLADRVDVRTEAVVLAKGQRFGLEIKDPNGADLVSIFNEGIGEERLAIRATFDDALGVEAVTIRYRLGGEDGELMLEIPRLALLGGRLARIAETSAGSGSGDTESVHVRRVGGRYIVVSDSEGGGGARQGCPGFLIIPPSTFGREFPNGLCADWIEVEPLDIDQITRGRASVTARGIGSFTVYDLSLNGS